ncbi:MAG: hypothetical protein HZC36_05165 [Armatimonadetes bacterium]|nr:hypothetical protein [Armatimonadota bacterium]
MPVEALGWSAFAVVSAMSAVFFCYGIRTIKQYAFEKIIIDEMGISWIDLHGRERVGAKWFEVHAMECRTSPGSEFSGSWEIQTDKGNVAFSELIERSAELVREVADRIGMEEQFDRRLRGRMKGGEVS